MGKIFKILTAVLLTASVGVATVVCCCMSSVVTAHFHKVSKCIDCGSKHSSHKHSSVPDGGCTFKLPNAEALYGQTGPLLMVPVHTPHFIFIRHSPKPFGPSAIIPYPRGAPPLFPSLAPPYLRTFNLRI